MNKVMDNDELIALNQNFSNYKIHTSSKTNKKKQSTFNKINIKRTRSQNSLNNQQDIQNPLKLQKIAPYITLDKMLDRIALNDKDNNDYKKSSRSIKIFSDGISSNSSISRNLFKNFYPLYLPSFYPKQILTQVISSQIDKINFSFSARRKLQLNESREILNAFEQKELSVKLLNHNSYEGGGKKHFAKQSALDKKINYLQEVSAIKGEWIEKEDNSKEEVEEEDLYEYSSEERYYNGDDEYDSNDENNSRNDYGDESSYSSEVKEEDDDEEEID